MTATPAPVAFLSGRWLLASQAAIPWWDWGFAQGVSVVEQLRTYGGRLPLLSEHLKRLGRGLTRLALLDKIPLENIRGAIEEIVRRNHGLLPSGSDLGICAVITPGSMRQYAPHSPDGPTVLVYSFPLPFAAFFSEYANGVRLATSSIRAVPDGCVPTDFKHRSRLNYFLAQQEIERHAAGCRPLLLNTDLSLADAATAGILLVRQGCVFAPREDQALSSVSVGVVQELAREAGIGLVRQSCTTDDLLAADEIIWCSTPTGLLPVVELDGRRLGEGFAGPLFRRLAQKWSARVGIDYLAQAREQIDAAPH